MKEKEAYTVGLQPSGSRAHILLHCSFPFGKELDSSPTHPEAARYGSAFHDILAGKLDPKLKKLLPVVGKKWGLREKVQAELKLHVDQASRTFTTWLSKNEFKIDFNAVARNGKLLLEKAVALEPGVAGRLTSPHDDEHRYHGLTKKEIPSTLDTGIVPAKKDRKRLPILVEDHKTGVDDFSRPEENPQLLTIAAAAMRMSGSEQAVVAVLHAPRIGLPKVYAEKVTLSDLKDHEAKLGAGLARIGDGSMGPGPWCHKWCPARDICPTQDSELLAKAGALLTGLTAAGGALSKYGLTANDLPGVVTKVSPGVSALSRDKKLGLLYSMGRAARKMVERINDEIRKEMLADSMCMPETPDGEYLTLREYERETLSKASVLAAYGDKIGERMLVKFRADGALKTSKIQQLYPEKERGGR